MTGRSSKNSGRSSRTGLITLRPKVTSASILTHRKGVDKSLEKVGEEAVEFILAAKNQVPERTVSEAADLLFHLLVALRASGIDVADVLDELAARRK